MGSGGSGGGSCRRLLGRLLRLAGGLFLRFGGGAIVREVLLGFVDGDDGCSALRIGGDEGPMRDADALRGENTFDRTVSTEDAGDLPWGEILPNFGMLGLRLVADREIELARVGGEDDVLRITALVETLGRLEKEGVLALLERARTLRFRHVELRGRGEAEETDESENETAAFHDEPQMVDVLFFWWPPCHHIKIIPPDKFTFFQSGTFCNFFPVTIYLPTT